MLHPSSGSPRPALVSVESACAELAIGKTSLYRLFGAGKLAAVKLGKRTMVPREALDAFIASLPAARPRVAS